MAMTDATEDAALNQLLRGEALPWSPPTLFLGLFTAGPTEAYVAANEVDSVVDPAYARQAIAFDPASGGATANTAQVQFPGATGLADYVVTHFGIFGDLSDTGVNALVYYGAFDVPITLSTAAALTFDAGKIIVTQS